MQLGCVGLGSMGSALARRLLKGDQDVTAWNRSADKVESLIVAGARRADKIADATTGVLVITMLTDDAAVEQVVFTPGAVLGAPGKAIHVSISTISVELATVWRRRIPRLPVVMSLRRSSKAPLRPDRAKRRFAL
jgi:3-hydroxyisobutyrate dehydrogenase-like beta-hydroxyacid dehydrogenase